MAQSEARICNMALLRIGVRQTINSLAENSPEAKACNELYSEARDQVLAAHGWPWATVRVLLAVSASGDAVDEEFGFEYKYALPTDCIRARFLFAGNRAPSAKERVPYTIEGTAKGVKYLLTDMKEARLAYVARVENVSAYPPHFVNALAWKLASELALALPIKPQLGLAAKDAYKNALHEAIGVVLSEQQEDVEPDSDFIRGRL